MSVDSQLPNNQYFGNGAQTVFIYTFEITSDADIGVSIDGQQYELDTEYAVSR